MTQDFKPNSSLDPEVISAFHCTGTSQSLSGDAGIAIRVGDCVFKRIENEERYNWACDLLKRLPRVGYRFSIPLRSSSGSFVYDGWGASTYQPGEHVGGKWEEKIRTARLFHEEINALEITIMPPSGDRWSKAHEIAWQALPLPTNLHPEMIRKIEHIFTLYEPLVRGNKIIHSDLCGNFLFHKVLDPCIIDFSPTYGTFEYGEAILVADATAWEEAPLEVVNLIAEDIQHRQNLLRAINFRIIVAALFLPEMPDCFLAQYAGYSPLIELLTG